MGIHDLRDLVGIPIFTPEGSQRHNEIEIGDPGSPISNLMGPPKFYDTDYYVSASLYPHPLPIAALIAFLSENERGL